MDQILKIITSIPVILLGSYLSILIGFFLILLRFCIREENKKKFILFLFVLGIILVIPYFIDTITGSKILSINTFISTGIYRSFLSFGKDLLILSVIFLFLLIFCESMLQQVEDYIKKYIEKEEQQMQEIPRENNIVMQDSVKNTHVVFCPYCGADNIIEGKSGICKFCRREIAYQENNDVNKK